MKTRILALSMIGLMVLTAAEARAEVKVELSAMHLCCGACVRGVEKAVANLPGVKVAVDKSSATTTITANDAASAEQAIALIAAAGFHGQSDNKTLVMKNDASVPSGNVKRIELGGIHNCCGGCTRAVKEAVKEVSGVTADSLKPKETTFVVEGDFSAAKLVRSLNDAGFHVRVIK